MEYLITYKRSIIFVFSFFIYGVGVCQLDQEQVDLWIETWPFDNPANSDSIIHWATQLEHAAEEINYSRAYNYAQRLMAYHYHYKGDIAKATEYYIDFLNRSGTEGFEMDRVSAISDLVYTYMTTGQFDLAKPLLKSTIEVSKNKYINPKQLSIFYNNLGIVYKNEELIDSAVWAYDQSLKLKIDLDDSSGIANLKVNLSSLYIFLGRYNEAIQLTDENLAYLGDSGNPGDIVYNLINKAAGLIEIGEIHRAERNALRALTMADEIGDVTLQQITTTSLSSFYYKSGKYKKAYEFQVKSEELKTVLINEQTGIKIAELREFYEADNREQQNLILSTKLLARQHQEKLYTSWIVGLIGVIGLLIWGWKMNKEKNIKLEENNKYIHNQNEKLTQLNTEKNNLISLVSHDLSSPFSTIKIWAQGLMKDVEENEIQEIKEVIIQQSDRALSSIHNVLTIDKNELFKLEIREFNIFEIISSAVDDFIKLAAHKNIEILINALPLELTMLSDASVIHRILGNLISNAIKYSHPQSTIKVISFVEDATFIFKVEDQGIGISEKDQMTIFNRYTTATLATTGAEERHGLGLSIVHRLVSELGGTISVQSELGKGSEFIIRIPV